MNQHTTPAPRNRIVAGVLFLVYVALMAIAFYLESTGGVDHWPSWALWMAGVTWGTLCLGLPFFVVKYFFGLNLMQGRPWRFSLRAMLLGVLYAGVFILLATQIYWIEQRKAWRSSNRAASRFTPGQAPSGLLRLFGEHGESRIVIQNGTKEQIAEAMRLFPEATVVASGESDRTQ